MSDGSDRTGRPVSARERAFPRELRRSETEQIDRRRRKAGRIDAASPPLDDYPEDIVGVALSGGGIRSATFCLGLFQALAAHNLLGKIDYVSTVSGGGYFGGFLGRLFTRCLLVPGDPRASDAAAEPGSWESTPPADGVSSAQQALTDPCSRALRWLRESGRYMSPNGAGDLILAGAVYLRNWAALQIVIALFILLGFLSAALLRIVIDRYLLGSRALENGYQLMILWTPYAVLPLAMFLLVMAPFGWAFWLTQGVHRKGRLESIPPWVTVALIGLFSILFCARAIALYRQGEPVPQFVYIYTCIAIYLSILSLLTLAAWRAVRPRADLGPIAGIRWQRNALSGGLASGLAATVALVIFSVADALGQTAYVFLSQHDFRLSTINVLSSLTGIVTVLTIVQRAASMLARIPKKTLPTLPLGVVATIISLLIASSIVIGLSVVAHGVAWRWQSPDVARGISLSSVAALWAILLALCLAIGRTFAFLNLSSHQALYGARLTRAYLGASNRGRWTGDGQKLTEVIPGDDIAMEEYRPQEAGGPLHLINVTLNETLDGKSQIEQRDRKGLALAVGPSGMSAGVSHHALWRNDAAGGGPARPGYRGIDPVWSNKRLDEFHIFAAGFAAGAPDPAADKDRSVETLGLGTWLSISGAAFTTGLGARTSLGLSLLLGLVNVRLGYWWDSDLLPEARVGRVTPSYSRRIGEKISRLFPVQTDLMDEFLARFHGPARQRWYLSDGGHFENTGCYELIRRRVRFIIACDNGEDADYAFEDLGGLIRKARIDFGAEIRFSTKDELGLLHPGARRFLGTLEDLRPPARAHATLAWVHYDGEATPGTTILFVKPTLMGDEPYDLLEYARAHPAFPQEPTADQFFDEAQWESYRKLGEVVGHRLFSPLSTPGAWAPGTFAGMVATGRG